MANVVVVGSQWGDEGKGKIVDWLSSQANVIVRFQGGHNAGHTIVTNGKTFKLHALPSSIVREGKISIIGNGVVLDPWHLLKEIDEIGKLGITINSENLLIADNAPLILPLHRHLDQVREKIAGKEKIGTTGRGIGPAYEDKVGRRALRAGDLLEPKLIPERVNKLLLHHNALLRGMDIEEIDPETLVSEILDVAPKIKPFVKPTWLFINEKRQAGEKILFEGAQGTMLDIDHGTYPFVTSSNIISAQAALGSGQGPESINYVLGITKAYTTRVGSGPFPSELLDEYGERLGKRGNEFGTTTGRSRRCGWFDAALVRQAVKLNGINGIALTKLDVLDGFDFLKICIGYRIDGETFDYMPASALAQKKAQPIYETIDGWSRNTRGSRSWTDLPAKAISYIQRLEALINAPVAILSTSPDREDTILLKDPFDH